MSTRKPAGNHTKKNATEPAAAPDNSLLDLIQPDDSLTAPADPTDDPMAAFAEPPPAPASGDDPLAALAAEFGADAGAAGAIPGLGDDAAIPGLGAFAMSGGSGEGAGEFSGEAAADLVLDAVGGITTSDPAAAFAMPAGEGAETATADEFQTFMGPEGEHAPAGTADLAGLVAPGGLDESSAGAADANDVTEPTTEAPIPTPAPASALQHPGAVIENVKRFSNQLGAGKADVAAAYPFSLLITGQLKPEEREKLLDLLSRADLGIREPDLEPQLEAGRLLIPRISEYAGVQIIQALRTAGVQFRLGPSDSIFSTADTRTSDEESLAPGEGADRSTAHPRDDVRHDADSLPITPEASLPQFPRARVVDFLTASAAISTSAVEAERSSEYAELLEALQRELKYKAYRRGAQAIVAFTTQLTSLASPTRYRLTVSGSAIRGGATAPGGGGASASDELENTL